MRAFSWAADSRDPHKRLANYRSRLAELKASREPHSKLDQDFRLGSIAHCEDMIRQLEISTLRARLVPDPEAQHTTT